MAVIQIKNTPWPRPRPANVRLLRALWSLLDGLWGILKGSWGGGGHEHGTVYAPRARPRV